MSAAAPNLQEGPKHAAPTIEIRVIRGGLASEEKPPRHAKAGVRSGMQGVGFDLSRKERAWALGFGILFMFAAFAVIVR